MTVPTHAALATKIYAAVSRVAPLKLDRRWFLYGNIYPDVSHYLVSAPHFADQSMGFVRRRILALCEYPVMGENLDAVYSMQLGILSHYLCDFFCHVHSSAYRGSMRGHFLYEIHQHTVMMRHPRLVGRRAASFAPGALPPDAQGILALLDDAQRAYLDAPHRADTDLVLAVKMASSIVASVLAVCAENARDVQLVPEVLLA